MVGDNLLEVVEVQDPVKLDRGMGNRCGSEREIGLSEQLKQCKYYTPGCIRDKEKENKSERGRADHLFQSFNDSGIRSTSCSFLPVPTISLYILSYCC